MKIRSTKTFTFAMAHLLSGHKGLCKNLHGHNYKMEVTAVAQSNNAVKEVGPAEGMVVDFKDLKQFVNEVIVNPLDHATMIWEDSKDPFEHDLCALLRKYDKKVVVVAYRPTAENMAADFMGRLNTILNATEADYRIEKIKLWETDSSYSEILPV